MIIRLFRENQIFTILLTFLIASLTVLYSSQIPSFSPDIDTLYLQGIFYLLPKLKLINNNQVLSVLLNILLTMLCGYYLSRIVVKYQIINIRASMPMFIFLILALPYFGEFQGFSYGLLTLLPLLVVIDMLFSSLDKKQLAFRFFDSTLIITTASFINPYLIFIDILIVIVWFQNRNFIWRELMFIGFGVLLPFLFLISIMYVAGKNIESVFYSIQRILEIRVVYDLKEVHYYLIGFIGFMILNASYQIARNYFTMKILIRKYSLIFLLLFLSISVITVLYPFTGRDIIFFFGLPLAFLFSYYFSVCKITVFNQLLFLVLTIGHILIVFFI